jgi:hypothetical protein
VNGEAIVDFFNRVRENYHDSGTIKLVLDGAGYHRSDIVKNEANKHLGRKRPSFKIVQSFIANDKANKALKSQC